MMTEREARQKVCDIITGWIGLSNKGKCPKEILDIYNSFASTNNIKWGSYPRKTSMQESWAWCACTVSAAGAKAGLAMIVLPFEMSCSALISEAKHKGIWCEDESNESAYDIGNLVIYDWQDDGNGDNTGAPDHVGMITFVDGDIVTVTEGNYSGTVKQRKIKKNAKYIRGIITPDYSSVADAEPPEERTNGVTLFCLQKGDKGQQVKALQILLNGRVGSNLTVDGSFGTKTKNAVIAAQKAFLMVQDGKVTLSLWNRLLNG